MTNKPEITNFKGLDITQFTISELCYAYETWQTITHVFSASCNAPVSFDSICGDWFEAELVRCYDALELIACELEKRTSEDEMQTSRRSAILITQKNSIGEYTPTQDEFMKAG